MTITLENVDVETLRVIESLKGLNKDLVITQEVDECPICKAHDYTLKPEVEREILESIAEMERELQKGTLKTYSDINELRKALES